MKRIVSLLLLIATLLFTFAGCKDNQPVSLASPQNVRVSDRGLVTWDEVENAESYVVTLNGRDIPVGTTSYQAQNLDADFVVKVTAKGDGEHYLDSAPSAEATYNAPRTPPVVLPEIKVGVSGKSEVRTGKTATYTAHVTGTEETTVIWDIVRGGEYATINATTGVLTAKDVESDAIVEVRATSLADETCFGTKLLTVVTKPVLTQDMIDALANQEKIGFEGFVNIMLYTIGLDASLEQSFSTAVKTSLDGVNWYAEYENNSIGAISRLYIKNHEGYASQVGVSFENEEEYYPVLDANDLPTTWADGGYYNNFDGLLVSDFQFNTDTWRYEYKGSDDTLPARMIASANPYDFVPENLALIIEDGEIMGLFSRSKKDYGIASGYAAIQELTVVINYGETVDVPAINRYVTDENGKHDILNQAIQNMQALTSYQLEFVETSASYLTSGYVTQGFTEYVTPNDCYFDPFTVKYSSDGSEIRHNTGAPYGFHKVSDTLYNAYISNETSDAYKSQRAYSEDFSSSKPTFKFVGEIFTAYYEDEEDNSITFYVDEPMSAVASTFYYGMGNDIALYGLFAQKGYVNSGQPITPYVKVKDGYIRETGFYFYIGSIFGIVEITYSDFNTATLPDDTLFAQTDYVFPVRQIPSKWEDLTIIVSKEGGSTDDDEEKNALLVLKEFFDDENAGDNMPFFGSVLGDTYGFGLTQYHRPAASSQMVPAIVFYYDVPLDQDYTIDASLKKVGDYLTSLGFVKNQYGEYEKDNLCVAPTDSSLDFVIYVWSK